MTAPDLTEPLAALRADPASAAVLCDIDGTLSPIVADPKAAVVPAPARALLVELARRYRLVACVSGRRASAARRMVGLDQLTYAGNHGLEVLRPGDTAPTLDPELGHRGTAAASFASRLDWRHLNGCGLRLEDKGPIQAIHWRGAEDPDLAGERAKKIASLAAEQGLVPHFGRLVLELRPLATVDKGIAVRRLISESASTAALYGGDDRTDLDAFAALRELEGDGTLRAGVCVGVASAEGPDEIRLEADLVVGGPDGFLDVLRAL
jgi:trehalose 6-phosphate phosphatase